MRHRSGRYREESGQHHALDIQHVGSTGAGGGSISEPAKIASGTVKAITSSQLTLDANGRASVFAPASGQRLRLARVISGG